MLNTTHKTRMIHIRLTDDRVRQLKVRAAMEDSTITKLVEQAVDTVYFADVPAKPNNNTKPPKVNGKAKPATTARRSSSPGADDQGGEARGAIDSRRPNVVGNPFAAG